MELTAVVQREGKLYVSWCPALEVASHGRTIQAALANLKEAIEIYFEDEDAPPISGRPMITTITVADPES